MADLQSFQANAQALAPLATRAASLVSDIGSKNAKLAQVQALERVAAQVSAELAPIQAEIEQKTARNAALRAQLAQLQASRSRT